MLVLVVATPAVGGLPSLLPMLLRFLVHRPPLAADDFEIHSADVPDAAHLVAEPSLNFLQRALSLVSTRPLAIYPHRWSQLGEYYGSLSSWPW